MYFTPVLLKYKNILRRILFIFLYSIDISSRSQELPPTARTRGVVAAGADLPSERPTDPPPPCAAEN